jgi:hypothetical protein
MPVTKHHAPGETAGKFSDGQALSKAWDNLAV